MRIGIFGVGGVGGYFGGKLASSGEDVTFIARGEHLRAMQQHGLQVDSIKGNFHVQPVQATDDAAKAGPLEVVILGVKAWQVSEAAGLLKPVIGEDTCVLPLQNGVEAPDQLAKILGKEHVLGGLCQISSRVIAPGHIAHLGIEPFVSLGELDGRTSQRVEQLRAAFDHAGVRVEVPQNIRAAIWAKFLFIAPISGVGSVTRAPVGVVRGLPETRRMLEAAMQEVEAVARAREIPLAVDAIVKTLAFIDSLPEGTIPSMENDILNGRPSELEAQNGAVVRLGSEIGVTTPVNLFIYSCLLPAEMRARKQINA